MSIFVPQKELMSSILVPFLEHVKRERKESSRYGTAFAFTLLHKRKEPARKQRRIPENRENFKIAL
jgi:hypothetical protein